MGFPGGTIIKNPPSTVGDARHMSLIPGSGRSPGVGNGNMIQYSCLENPMDRGAWWAAVHRVAKSQTLLRNLAHTHTIHAVSSHHKIPRIRNTYSSNWLYIALE